MSLKILIINQNDELCGTTCRFLIAEGHQAICCLYEKTKLQKALEICPDIIIIEVSMPESSAIEIVSSLHRNPATRQTPLIVISDFPALELELLHIFDFICRPVDMIRLREDISILVSGAKKRDAVIKLPPLANVDHEKFHDYLIKYSGLHFERRNIKTLERGLANRMTALHIGSFSEYYEYLCNNMESRNELQKLIQFLTVGETFFFRYHAHFDVLVRTVLPQLLYTKQQKKLRIWSAGCSTGEEPYSIAMAIMENIPHWQQLDIKIVATDINSRSLRRAKEGVYTDWKVRVTEKAYLERYFKRIGASYVVRDEVKALVDFSYFNLQAPPLSVGEAVDIIFCRNVMIYFTTATTRKIVDNFAASLNDGGYLFLGHSETLAHISSKFERHIHDGGFYYRKKGEPVEKPVAAPLKPGVTEKPASPLRQTALSRAVLPPPLQTIDAETLYAQGMSFLRQMSFAEATVIFEKLLQQCPDHAGGVLGMGQLHLVNGRIDKALDSCNRALFLDDLLHDGYYFRGLLYEMCEREREAVDEYRKAILLKMDFIMAHYQLGKLYFRGGDHRAGLRELRNTLNLLEKCAWESIIPFSGGLSKEVFIGELHNEIQRVEVVIAGESA